MAVQEEYSTEEIHRVARIAYGYMAETDSKKDKTKTRTISQLTKHGESLAEAINELETSFPETTDILDEMDELYEEKVDAAAMQDCLSFLDSKYDAAEKWTENNNYTRWQGSDFDTEEIKKVSTILDGFIDPFLFKISEYVPPSQR